MLSDSHYQESQEDWMNRMGWRPIEPSYNPCSMCGENYYSKQLDEDGKCKFCANEN